MAAAQDSGTDRSSRPFWVGLLAVLIALLLAGVAGFWYLSATGPLTLREGGDRPIAAATLFVPAKSPLTFSLLTRPERIVAFQQAVVEPSQRQQAIREIEQLKHSLLDNTQVDYDRDIQPWIGNEITFALTGRDLDPNQAGQQPGYLTVLEIAPERQQQAREFLQLFWQRQSLANGPPMAEVVSGARVLSAKPSSAVASALVGSQFVMFANDVRVLRRSLQAAQTATNLAQDRAYRQAVAQLPPERVGLAYVDTRLAQDIGRATTIGLATPDAPQFAAVGLGISTTGLVAKARLAETTLTNKVAGEALSEPVAALAFLPANSAIALASYDLTQLEPSLAEVGLSTDVLPNFLRLGADSAGGMGTSSLWDWAIADYALGQIRAGGQTDWVLAVSRQAEGIARLDQAVMAQGYSVVPVAIGESEATAWTRFKARLRSRTASNSLETEVLGLHLQQGDYEIFASSVAAMESALGSFLESSLGASQSSLLASARFAKAIAPLDNVNSGYLYADLTAILQQRSTTEAAAPLLKLVEAAARPFIRHIDTFAATRDGPAASLSVQLRQAGEARQNPGR